MNPKKEDNGGWYGFDLDGTLATYDGFKGEEHVGEPTPLVDMVKKMLAEGKDVRLFTARRPHPAIRRWMVKHLGAQIPITNTKDEHMIGLWDDRAVGVRRNEGVPFDEENEDQIFEE